MPLLYTGCDVILKYTTFDPTLIELTLIDGGIFDVTSLLDGESVISVSKLIRTSVSLTCSLILFVVI